MVKKSMRNTAFRMPGSLLAELDEATQDAKGGRSAFVREAVRERLDRIRVSRDQAA